MKFYQMSIDQTTQNLNTDIKNGLSKKEAKKRISKYGENIIPEKKPLSAFLIFLNQFLNPLIIILIFAIGICLSIHSFKDAAVIAITMILNVIIGFIQEFRAEKEAQNLKKLEVPHCTVKRDGQITIIKAKDLVPGDLVLLSAGSRIPADIRLTYAVNFTVEQAILTGEAKPVNKNLEEIKTEVTSSETSNIAFAGTTVLSGKAEGIVISTGKESQLGKIAELITQTKREESPLQIKIKKLSWVLAAIFLATSAIIVVIGLIKGMSFIEILMISIALAVAAIPEGLIIAVTVILAVGMHRMLKRHALVRHLIAAETLGSVSIICTDKTGTITKGHMQVVRLITQKHDLKVTEEKMEDLGDEVEHLLTNIILNNDAKQDLQTKKILGTSTEAPILEYVTEKTNLNAEQIRINFERIDEIPFSSEIKFMATVHKFNDQQKLIVKGAPEKVFTMCLQNSDLEKFKNFTQDMSKEGLRVLAVAEKIGDKINLKTDLKNLNLIGLVGIEDPLRPTAKTTVDELKKAGIRVVLVTGDNPDTALNIAQKANITADENRIILGIDLDKMSDDQLKKEILNIDIFARVEPAHKIRIVKAWQSNGESVAMIGDGVNDAPALKAADIGVAPGSGCDVAQETADMVLLDNNLASIDAAVKEGRCIFDNIRKIITFLLTDCFGEIALIGLCILFNIPLPILAPQILWINLIGHGLPYLAMEPAEPGIMQEPPRKKSEPLLNAEMKTIIFIVGTLANLIIFYTYFMLLKTDYDFAHTKTIVFTSLAIGSTFFAFPLKSFRRSVFQTKIFSNPLMIWTVLISILMQIAIVYFYPLQKLFDTTSLIWFDWLIIMALVLIKAISIEGTKFLFLLKKKNTVIFKVKSKRKNVSKKNLS